MTVPRPTEPLDARFIDCMARGSTARRLTFTAEGKVTWFQFEFGYEEYAAGVPEEGHYQRLGDVVHVTLPAGARAALKQLAAAVGGARKAEEDSTRFKLVEASGRIYLVLDAALSDFEAATKGLTLAEDDIPMGSFVQQK
jgi:hypothetical protein